MVMIMVKFGNTFTYNIKSVANFIVTIRCIVAALMRFQSVSRTNLITHESSSGFSGQREVKIEFLYIALATK